MVERLGVLAKAARARLESCESAASQPRRRPPRLNAPLGQNQTKPRQLKMANPTQRRKARSGSTKNTMSKRSKKNKHKVIVNGPEMLVKGWDKTKTIRQNYLALGLMPKLNPRQAGGIEAIEPVPFAVQQQTEATMDDLLQADLDAESDEEEEGVAPTASTSTAAAPVAQGKLAPGMARIIRDENGKVIKIVMAGQDGEEVEEEVKKIVRDSDEDEDEDGDDESDDDDELEPSGAQTTPWGAPMNEFAIERGDALLEEQPVSGPRKTGQGIPIHPRREVVHAKTDVVRKLEAYAATDRGKVIRHTSEFEGDWLLSMVAKYDDDVEKMARDRKINPLQRTAGELKRHIAKAGGFSKLRVKLQRRLAEEAASA